MSSKQLIILGKYFSAAPGTVPSVMNGRVNDGWLLDASRDSSEQRPGAIPGHYGDDDRYSQHSIYDRPLMTDDFTARLIVHEEP